MRTVSILCATVFLLCLAVCPVVGYAGGRLCRPLDLLGFPAEFTMAALGFLAAVVLVLSVIKSLLIRRRRAWTVGALAVTIAAGAGLWFCTPEWPGFLEGLRDRFVKEVGYPKMREFAREVSQVGPEVVVGRLDLLSTPGAPQPQKQWDELVGRYPFLGWNDGATTVVVRDGIVQVTWGSALVGHWGFETEPEGVVRDVEKDHGVALKVADDIQFIYID